MTLASDPHLDLDFALDNGLRAYVLAVSAAVGTGWEACSVDSGTPMTAYIAVDGSVPGHGACDVALLWHEDRGWAVVLETPSGEDLTLARLGGPVVAAPEAVAGFLAAVRSGTRPAARPVVPSSSVELAAELGAYQVDPLP
ncbi:DUF6292 family protein [Amycolatopsis dongchuanensis]|uniref:DUF6292 family protein n=1 Tax=Amycolatopsis dongchuanensis TaxID=1070866 RepID=A0ABP9R436_9PSEU